MTSPCVDCDRDQARLRAWLNVLTGLGTVLWAAKELRALRRAHDADMAAIQAEIDAVEAAAGAPALHDVSAPAEATAESAQEPA